MLLFSNIQFLLFRHQAGKTAFPGCRIDRAAGGGHCKQGENAKKDKRLHADRLKMVLSLNVPGKDKLKRT
ncbi:hypothetical protein GCM10011332_26980 [Terasakiella brassicae]|uniref:Uncharacterized protein n=1 Tax=Terasakiella brassicae TaxID=1634917 RepID=A0A917C490_9PROT|nr:hypothetical protein GCM10011332_26980 [Terasakiella brassicae]